MNIQLKEILKIKGVSMAELSTRTGIAAPNISNFVKGKNTPNLDTLERIAEALDVPVSDLLQSKDVTGFIKWRGVIYEVASIPDLERITSMVRQG